MDSQLLVENFRSKLQEQQNTSNLGLAIFGSEEDRDILLYLYDITEMEDLINSEDQQDAREEWSRVEGFYHLGISVGMIAVQKPFDKAKGECLGSWEVYRSAVHSNWKGKGVGKLLYEMAMALSGAPIMSDRFSVSPEAGRVWSSLADTHHQTDDFDNVENPQTPPPEDDCVVGREGTTDWGVEIDPSKETKIEQKIKQFHKKHKNFMEEELIPWVGYSKNVIEAKFRTLAIDLFRKEYYE